MVEEWIMKVIIGKTVYDLSEKQLEAVLNIAKKQVPVGIYAVRQNGVIELKNKRYKSGKYMKKAVDKYESKGFIVYCNGESK